jgi:hypothetical protein
MNVSEIRLSLLEYDASGKNTKHIAVTATDPILCANIQALIEPDIDLGKTDDASHVELKTSKGAAAAQSATEAKVSAAYARGLADGEAKAKAVEPGKPTA